MSTPVPLANEAEPFTQGGLDALLAAAAQDCPDAVLVADDSGPSTAADLARRIRRLAAQLRLAGLMPGERLLIVGGAQTAALVALAAALSARLDPVLAPCGLGPVEIAACATAAGAVALIGPSRYGSLELGEVYLSAAALADGIRLIATQGPEPVDGAADVSFAALDAMEAAEAIPATTRELSKIGTFQGSPINPVLILHRQAVLLADALSLVEQARINPSARVISTLPPTTLAGLVAGPFAALIGASGLVLHGPFEARGFLAACDAERGYHLVAPAAIGPIFAEKALSADIASLILVSRHPGNGFVLPETVFCERPVVDLYAFAEDNVITQRRVDGVASPPARIGNPQGAADLGAKLNRAQAGYRVHGGERS